MGSPEIATCLQSAMLDSVAGRRNSVTILDVRISIVGTQPRGLLDDHQSWGTLSERNLDNSALHLSNDHRVALGLPTARSRKVHTRWGNNKNVHRRGLSDTRGVVPNMDGAVQIGQHRSLDCVRFRHEHAG